MTAGQGKTPTVQNRRGRSRRLHETRVQLEVPFHDVDPLQVVWHGHYYKYFEVARTRLLRSLELDAGEVIGGRYLLMVSESRCRHTFPLRYGERFEVAAWFRDVTNRLCIDYELINLDHARRSARGHTILVSLNRDGRLLLRTPKAILDRIGDSDAQNGAA
jgi:acyl-CoA thioester hydrolase